MWDRLIKGKYPCLYLKKAAAAEPLENSREEGLREREREIQPGLVDELAPEKEKEKEKGKEETNLLRG